MDYGVIGSCNCCKLPERTELFRRFVEPRDGVACGQPDDAFFRACFPVGGHMQPEHTVRGSKQPFMSDKLGHRLVVDHRVLAGCQEKHGHLETQKNVSDSKTLATPNRYIHARTAVAQVNYLFGISQNLKEKLKNPSGFIVCLLGCGRSSRMRLKQAGEAKPSW